MADFYHLLMLNEEFEEEQAANRHDRNPLHRYCRTSRVWTFENAPEASFNRKFRFHKCHVERMARLLHIPDNFTLSNETKLPGIDCFCVMLYRLAHASSLRVMEDLFQRDDTIIGRMFNECLNFLHHRFQDKLSWDLSLLTVEHISNYSERVHETGCPMNKCFLFIDGTFQQIARPSGHQDNQRVMYNGRKKKHCLNWQALTSPSGMIVSMLGPAEGRSHDTRMYRDFNTLNKLNALHYPENDGEGDENYHIYGDKGYWNDERMMTPSRGNNMTAEERAYNREMATYRVSVENCFAILANHWRFPSAINCQRIHGSPVANNYLVTILVYNMHCCLYENEVSVRFDCAPPSLEDYLA